jgi:hypothetical protein
MMSEIPMGCLRRETTPYHADRGAATREEVKTKMVKRAGNAVEWSEQDGKESKQDGAVRH